MIGFSRFVWWRKCNRKASCSHYVQHVVYCQPNEHDQCQRDRSAMRLLTGSHSHKHIFICNNVHCHLLLVVMQFQPSQGSPFNGTPVALVSIFWHGDHPQETVVQPRLFCGLRDAGGKCGGPMAHIAAPLVLTCLNPRGPMGCFRPICHFYPFLSISRVLHTVFAICRKKNMISGRWPVAIQTLGNHGSWGLTEISSKKGSAVRTRWWMLAAMNQPLIWCMIIILTWLFQ